MAQGIATEIIQRWQALKGQRGTWEQHWQEVAEVFRPMRADFTTERTEGSKRAERIYDGAPLTALDNLQSGLWGMITNSANQWFALGHPDKALEAYYPVKAWLAEVTQIMRAAFDQQGQRFYARAVDLYGDLAAFGTGIMYVDEDVGGGRLRFSCRRLAECVIAQDDSETVDTVIRRFRFTARQALQRWGEEAGAEIAKAAATEPDRLYSILHAVEPEPDPDRARRRGMRWRSVHVLEETGRVLQRGGFREFPYQVPRWATLSNSVYGDSPCMLALADGKMLNAMVKTHLTAAQKAANPPLLAHDEDILSEVRVTPGGITYGGISPDGRALVQPLQAGADFSVSIEEIRARREAIRDALYFSLLMMVRAPNQTATEVLERQEEKLRLMGPHLGRIQSEFLHPLIQRVFSILVRAGALPPLPAELAAAPSIQIEFVSPLARAQRTSEASAVVRAVQQVAALAQVAPSALDVLDVDQAARVMVEGFGAPPAILRDPRIVAQERQQRRQQQEMMQAMAAGAQLEGAAA